MGRGIRLYTIYLHRCVVVVRFLYIIPDASRDGSHAKASCNPDDVLALIALNVRYNFCQRVGRHVKHVALGWGLHVTKQLLRLIGAWHKRCNVDIRGLFWLLGTCHPPANLPETGVTHEYKILNTNLGKRAQLVRHVVWC